MRARLCLAEATVPVHAEAKRPAIAPRGGPFERLHPGAARSRRPRGAPRRRRPRGLAWRRAGDRPGGRGRCPGSRLAAVGSRRDAPGGSRAPVQSRRTARAEGRGVGADAHRGADGCGCAGSKECGERARTSARVGGEGADRRGAARRLGQVTCASPGACAGRGHGQARPRGGRRASRVGPGGRRRADAHRRQRRGHAPPRRVEGGDEPGRRRAPLRPGRRSGDALPRRDRGGRPRGAGREVSVRAIGAGQGCRRGDGDLAGRAAGSVPGAHDARLRLRAAPRAAGERVGDGGRVRAGAVVGGRTTHRRDLDARRGSLPDRLAGQGAQPGDDLAGRARARGAPPRMGQRPDLEHMAGLGERHRRRVARPSHASRAPRPALPLPRGRRAGRVAPDAGRRARARVLSPAR